MRKLPPLAAVRVFEAAARHGSFTRAADELGMTQAAVSYQIKLLEQRVGTPLFLRLARHVVLTEAGQQVAPVVSQALDALSTAFAAIHDGSEGVLTITALHTFASNWLAPRLGAFQLAHPNLAVRLDVSTRLVDFAREEVDVGIRGGQGNWPGLTSHLLYRSHFAPMCSPDLVERENIRTPSDLLRLPLLSSDDPWWVSWFELAGVDATGISARPGVRLDSQQIQGNAAMGGQGVAMLTPALWTAELGSGRLVQPFPLVGIDDGGTWLVYPEHKRRTQKVRAFREWLLAEIALLAASDTLGVFRTKADQ